MNSISQRAKEIFVSLVDDIPKAEWDDRADEACQGDLELRRRVHALLLAHAEPDSRLENVAIDFPLTEIRPITEQPGDTIGPYKLLQQIGEGGMGVVYMAEQKEPVKRRVALKIIKPGMDTRQVIARFEAERQALAMMDHPNIAKVLDAGATESGRPYFVMELVNGISITQYCDEQHLTLKERLALFVPVCQAVQHAHQKGIIHRDLKPSNILVALYDGQAVPKIIDFGVAKATSQTLTEKTMFTQLGQVVGTLEYMSPEQAERSQLDIDTRSDIYSLGVVLYELLTGETPFDRERLRSAAYDEILRIIREEEPSKPSANVSSSQSLPSIAASRRIEPRRLGSMIRGELDWIVLKAMEKDRGRRYETASKFAEDVQHYLNDEPVVACPPSSAYLFGKLARRYRAQLATAGVLTLGLLMAVSGVGWAVRDRVAQRAVAEREKTHRQERITAHVDLLLADVDRLAQERKWDEALATAKRAEAALVSGEVEVVVIEKVRTAVLELEFVTELDEIRMEMAVWDGHGFDVAGAAKRYGQAFRDFGIDLDALPPATAVVQLKRHPRITLPLLVALDQIVKIRRETEPAGDGDIEWTSLVETARELDQQPLRNQLRGIWGRKVTPEIQVALRKLVESYDPRVQGPQTAERLAFTLGRAGLPDLSEQVLRSAQREFPGDYWVNLELGNLLYGRNDYVKAVRFFNAALSIRPGNFAALNNLSIALTKLGQQNEAIACFRKAIELKPNHAMAYNNLGNALMKSVPHLDEAIVSFRKAIELDPNYAKAHSNLGVALRKQGKLDEAVNCFRKAIKLDQKLAPAHFNLGSTRESQGKLEEAVDCFRKGIEFDPRNAAAHSNLGNALIKLKQLDEAIVCFRKAIELDPNDAAAHFNLGNAFMNLEQLDEAISCFLKAIEVDPNYAKAHSNLGVVRLKQGRLDAAIACFREAVELDPKLAPARLNLVNTLANQGQLDEAIACLRTALEFLPQDSVLHKNLNTLSAIWTNGSWQFATATDPSKRDPTRAVGLAKLAIEAKRDSGNNWNNLGVAEYRAGNWQAAVEALEKADKMIDGGDRAHRMFLAMARWRLNEREKAREAYAQGAVWIAKQRKGHEEHMRFRAEAEGLMGITEQDRNRMIAEYRASSTKLSDPSQDEM